MPGVCDVPAGGYKDAGEPGKGIPPRVKRQAARFRIFGYDRDGKVVKIYTGNEWTPAQIVADLEKLP